MITTRIDAVLPPQSGIGRSEGVHLSRVLKGIAVESASKILDPKYAEDLSLEEVAGNQEVWWENLPFPTRLKMCMGLAWEDWYIPHLGTVAYHPGEMQLEGIYMTHDGESVDTIWTGKMELCCHEVKLTYKSTNTCTPLKTQWLWLAQLKGYCKGLGVRVGFLHILYACGDYSYPITPQLHVWKIEFSQEEIDEEWDVITGYVKHRQALEQADREDDGVE